MTETETLVRSSMIEGQIYSSSQIKSVLKSIGVDMISETGNDFLCLCPFHGNRNTPSFSVSKERGAFICFNPSCGESGSIVDLVKRLTDRNEFEAIRFVKIKQVESAVDLEEELSSVLSEKPDFEEFSNEIISNLSSNMSLMSEGMDYMLSRGFTKETVSYFNIGYSDKQDMVTVPVHSPDGICVGIVGRHVSEKRFKNSPGLPKNKTLFNIHRAKRVSPVAIVTEASFDAMRIHQAGYPNAVATLGGHISKENTDLLNKYFTKIIIMTDNDEAGRSLGNNIAKRLKSKEILWAMYDYETVYPHGAKDVGDMTDAEIKQCISNAVPHFQYANNMV